MQSESVFLLRIHEKVSLGFPDWLGEATVLGNVAITGPFRIFDRFCDDQGEEEDRGHEKEKGRRNYRQEVSSAHIHWPTGWRQNPINNLISYLLDGGKKEKRRIRRLLEPWSSTCDSQTSSISITQDLVRKCKFCGTGGRTNRTFQYQVLRNSVEMC